MLITLLYVFDVKDSMMKVFSCSGFALAVEVDSGCTVQIKLSYINTYICGEVLVQL